MDEHKLLSAIKQFKNKQQTPKFVETLQERNDRVKYYQSFTADKIKNLNIDDMYEYISNLWSMLIWGNKQYIVDKIINENGFDNLKEHLVNLIYGKEQVDKRWNTFLSDIKGLGPSTVSELLSYSNPNEYVIFNKTSIKCFEYLSIKNLPLYNYQFTGEKYIELCNIAKNIAKIMKKENIEDVSLLTVDFLLWDEIFPLTNKKNKNKDENKVTNDECLYLHDEIKQKVVEIGTLLGFRSRSEFPIAKGARVDAVWEVNIGNMGTVNYVFEVQTKGDINSLLLNLEKASNKPSVQSVVAISASKQLNKIEEEANEIQLGKVLKTWDIKDVLEVHDNLSKAYTIINQLGLVPKSLFNKE